MYVLFLHGPAAAGKHTIGSLVSAALGIPLFHNHLTVDLALSLFEFGSEGFRNVRAEVWRAAFREAAAARQSFVFTFHPEVTVAPGLVDELTASVAGGGSAFFVELACDRATVLERISAESRQRFGKLTDPERYAAIEAAGGFAYAGKLPHDLRVDTAALSPAEAASVIVDAVRARGLT